MHLFIHMVERALLAITRYNIFWQVITCYNYICRCSYICYTEALQKVPFFFFCYINGRLYTQRVLKTRAHPHGEAIHANRPRDHWHFKRYFRFISWYNWLTGQSSYLFFYLSKNTAWIRSLTLQKVFWIHLMIQLINRSKFIFVFLFIQKHCMNPDQACILFSSFPLFSHPT